MNNFYLYRLENQDKHVLIAWDTDNTFWGPTVPDQAGRHQRPDAEVDAHPGIQRAVVRGDRSAPTQMAEADGWLDTEIIRNVQLIDAAMREDVYKPYSNNSFEGEAGEMLSFARERDRVREVRAGAGRSRLRRIEPGAYRCLRCLRCLAWRRDVERLVTSSVRLVPIS